LNNILRLLFLSFLLAVLIVRVFGGGPVTAHRIRGAIVVYLLLGGRWGVLYPVVALTIPYVFRFPEGLAVSDPEALSRILTYFSFTTLTTTGFGDITPTHPLARTLAMFEALAGQLFLVNKTETSLFFSGLRGVGRTGVARLYCSSLAAALSSSGFPAGSGWRRRSLSRWVRT